MICLAEFIRALPEYGLVYVKWEGEGVFIHATLPMSSQVVDALRVLRVAVRRASRAGFDIATDDDGEADAVDAVFAAISNTERPDVFVYYKMIEAVTPRGTVHCTLSGSISTEAMSAP